MPVTGPGPRAELGANAGPKGDRPATDAKVVGQQGIGPARPGILAPLGPLTRGEERRKGSRLLEQDDREMRKRRAAGSRSMRGKR